MIYDSRYYGFDVMAQFSISFRSCKKFEVLIFETGHLYFISSRQSICEILGIPGSPP